MQKSVAYSTIAEKSYVLSIADFLTEFLPSWVPRTRSNSRRSRHFWELPTRTKMELSIFRYFETLPVRNQLFNKINQKVPTMARSLKVCGKDWRLSGLAVEFLKRSGSSGRSLTNWTQVSKWIYSAVFFVSFKIDISCDLELQFTLYRREWVHLQIWDDGNNIRMWFSWQRQVRPVLANTETFKWI